MIVSQKPQFSSSLSFPRRRESSNFSTFWISACAGMTEQEAFYETINDEKYLRYHCSCTFLYHHLIADKTKRVGKENIN